MGMLVVQSRKILQLLRLRQIYNGIFIKINKATVNMLRLVEPYIAWGYPNLKSVRELIYKRGYGKVIEWFVSSPSTVMFVEATWLSTQCWISSRYIVVNCCVRIDHSANRVFGF